MARTKNELIQCEYCGEMYSITYKRCPFCNGDGTGAWDDETSESRAGSGTGTEPAQEGGKRLVSEERSKNVPIRNIIRGAVSLMLIIAAFSIMFNIVRSAMGGKKINQPPTPSTKPPAEVTQLPQATDEPEESTAPIDTLPPVESDDPVASTPPAVIDPSDVNIVAPTAFTLNREDFTFDTVGQVFDMKVKFTPADAAAEVTWTSSNPNIASITWNGRVTAVSSGTVTLTASVPGLGEKTCICRCNFTSSSASGNSGAASSSLSTNLKLSREDFTLDAKGSSYRLTVKGTNSTPTWSSSNPNVATVGADGTVTAVGKGTCTAICSVDGKTLKCIVRCNF